VDYLPQRVGVVDDVDRPRPGDEHEIVARAPDFEPLDAAVLLEHHAEVRVRLLHDLEARSLAHLNLAVPGVQARDVFLGGELAHLLQGVGADREYLAPLCDQDDRVVVVENAAQNRQCRLKGLGLEQLVLEVALVERAVRVANQHLVALVGGRHAGHVCGVELGRVVLTPADLEAGLVFEQRLEVHVQRPVFALQAHFGLVLEQQTNLRLLLRMAHKVHLIEFGGYIFDFTHHAERQGFVF